MSTGRSGSTLKSSLHLSLLTVLFNCCLACMTNTAATAVFSTPASSQTVKVDVSMSNQTLEG
jgi:hypothetical protein